MICGTSGFPITVSSSVFIFPSLSEGNIAYKIAERMGGYTALGPMIQGLQHSMHDLSRGCSATDILEETLLAMKMAPAQEGHTSPSTAALASGTGKR